MNSTGARKWFIIDGFGAALSTIMLGLILPHYQTFLGIPNGILEILVLPPFFFLLFDLGVLVFRPNRLKPYLIGIALFNVAYVLLSLILLGLHAADIQLFAFLYFAGELLIVGWMAYQEMTCARRLG